MRSPDRPSRVGEGIDSQAALDIRHGIPYILTLATVGVVEKLGLR